MIYINEWIMSILAIVILGVLLDLLLSGTKVHKLIKTIFASVTILIIITPIPSLVKGGLSGNGTNIFEKNIELDVGYLDYTNNALAILMEKGVEESLANDGIKNVKVSITAEFNKEITISEVKINIQNIVIDKNYLHINKQEYIKDKVSGYLNIKRGIIVIYE